MTAKERAPDQSISQRAWLLWDKIRKDSARLAASDYRAFFAGQAESLTDLAELVFKLAEPPEKPHFAVGDAVILLDEQPVDGDVLVTRILPIGCIGFVTRISPDSEPPLAAVNFGAMGEIWCVSAKLGFANREYVERCMGPFGSSSPRPGSRP